MTTTLTEKQYDHIRVEKNVEKQTATIVLDRPEKMNFISMLGRDQLVEIFEKLNLDNEVRVIVIKGEGDVCFSAGGSIPEFMETHQEKLSHLAENVAAPERSPKPVIAQLQGYTFGVGLELAMACDFRIAAEDTLLALPEMNLGMIPGSGGTQRIAKIAGLKMCQFYREQYDCNFISLMPTNLYGPNDNFDLKNSHVLPALLRKFHEAKINKNSSVILWGTGNPLREFLHVNDLANACIHFMLSYNEKSPVNIGTGKDISIHDLATEIKKIVEFEGEIIWDKNKPDGTPRKLLDVTKAKQFGWESSITLLDGIRMTYDWYVQNKGK